MPILTCVAALFANNRNVVKWNASVGKKFLKDESLLTQFSVNDILNQNIGFNRNASSNNITERTCNYYPQVLADEADLEFHQKVPLLLPVISKPIYYSVMKYHCFCTVACWAFRWWHNPTVCYQRKIEFERKYNVQTIWGWWNLTGWTAKKMIPNSTSRILIWVLKVIVQCTNLVVIILIIIRPSMFGSMPATENIVQSDFAAAILCLQASVWAELPGTGQPE